MSNITKNFGKLCKFFLKKTCQKICTIQKFVLLLHPFSARVRQQARKSPYRSAKWKGDLCLRSSRRKCFAGLRREVA